MTSQVRGGNTQELWRETLLEPLKDFAALSEALHRKLQEKSKSHSPELALRPAQSLWQKDAAVPRLW